MIVPNLNLGIWMKGIRVANVTAVWNWWHKPTDACMYACILMIHAGFLKVKTVEIKHNF